MRSLALIAEDPRVSQCLWPDRSLLPKTCQPPSVPAPAVPSAGQPAPPLGLCMSHPSLLARPLVAHTLTSAPGSEGSPRQEERGAASVLSRFVSRFLLLFASGHL